MTSQVPSSVIRTLTKATSYVVDEAIRAECELSFDTPYRWYIYVVNGNGSDGFGISYYYRNISFRSQ